MTSANTLRYCEGRIPPGAPFEFKPILLYVNHFAVFVMLPRSWDRSPVRLEVMQGITETNPLLRIDFRIPFDRIRAEHVQPATAELLREARARLAALAGQAGVRTFDNTMRVLGEVTEPLDVGLAVAGRLGVAAP